ncbi:hypothetical protein C8R44DRAFT_875147 [Mycena epipterygia]|nr:hypothetical protein C8R44DRAFT_875147 [Mycena epipterygia]
MRLTDLGHDILLEICAQVFEDNPRDRVVLSWCWGSQESTRPRIFPGPPAQILLDLASMHSELATAIRPYIWREVLVAVGSYDKTEARIGRLERAQRPHIAPFVRAIFLSFYGHPENFLQRIVTAIPHFTSLRAVCLGSFQTYAQPRLYKDLAEVIREHPCIDTLNVRLMTHCADLIKQNSSKPYSIELHNCHSNSTALLLRPKAIRFLRLHNWEPQKLDENCPPDIWDTMEHFDPGRDDCDWPPKNHQILRASLQKFLDQGRRPAMTSLDLSGVRPDEVAQWLAVVRNLDIDSFTYIPDTKAGVEVLGKFLKYFPKVRRLDIGLPVDEENYDEDSDEEKSSDEDSEDEDNFDEDLDESQFKLDPRVLNMLSHLRNLERLTLNAELSYHLVNELEDELEEEAAALGRSAVEMLGEDCPLLRTVQLVFEWESMRCENNPVVVEYNIHRHGGEMGVDVVAPRLLEGTIFDFLQRK